MIPLICCLSPPPLVRSCCKTPEEGALLGPPGPVCGHSSLPGGSRAGGRGWSDLLMSVLQLPLGSYAQACSPPEFWEVPPCPALLSGNSFAVNGKAKAKRSAFPSPQKPSSQGFCLCFYPYDPTSHFLFPLLLFLPRPEPHAGCAAEFPCPSSLLPPPRYAFSIQVQMLKAQPGPWPLLLNSLTCKARPSVTPPRIPSWWPELLVGGASVPESMPCPCLLNLPCLLPLPFNLFFSPSDADGSWWLGSRACHRCCIMYRWKARPSSREKTATCFIAILTLLPGTAVFGGRPVSCGLSLLP